MPAIIIGKLLGLAEFMELSGRECECLTLVAAGHKHDRIADKLNISVHTVEFHLKNVKQKLGANSIAHAVALAVSAGVIGV